MRLLPALIIITTLFSACSEVKMPPKPEPVPHCPICLETKVYKKGEPYYWIPRPQASYSFNGKTSQTIYPSRHVSTRYVCQRGHQFETSCTNAGLCVVFVCKEGSMAATDGCLVKLEETQQ